MSGAVLGALCDFYGNALPTYAKLSPSQQRNDDAAVAAALRSNVTNASQSARLQAIVRATDVTLPLPCCATCGVRPLPDIPQPRLGRRPPSVDQSLLVDVPLAALADRHPWVLLEREQCAVCSLDVASTARPWRFPPGRPQHTALAPAAVHH